MRDCDIINYCKVASNNACYKFKKYFLVKRSQNISIKNPLHNQSEKACMCFKTRRASTRDYTVHAYETARCGTQPRKSKSTKKFLKYRISKLAKTTLIEL